MVTKTPRMVDENMKKRKVTSASMMITGKIQCMENCRIQNALGVDSGKDKSIILTQKWNQEKGEYHWIDENDIRWEVWAKQIND